MNIRFLCIVYVIIQYKYYALHYCVHNCAPLSNSYPVISDGTHHSSVQIFFQAGQVQAEVRFRPDFFLGQNKRKNLWKIGRSTNSWWDGENQYDTNTILLIHIRKIRKVTMTIIYVFGFVRFPTISCYWS